MYDYEFRYSLILASVDRITDFLLTEENIEDAVVSEREGGGGKREGRDEIGMIHLRRRDHWILAQEERISIETLRCSILLRSVHSKHLPPYLGRAAYVPNAKRDTVY